MKSFSESAARTWPKEHVRDCFDTRVQHIEDIVIDLSHETEPYMKKVLREKLDSLREERDFLKSLLR